MKNIEGCVWRCSCLRLFLSSHYFKAIAKREWERKGKRRGTVSHWRLRQTPWSLRGETRESSQWWVSSAQSRWDKELFPGLWSADRRLLFKSNIRRNKTEPSFSRRNGKKRSRCNGAMTSLNHLNDVHSTHCTCQAPSWFNCLRWPQVQLPFYLRVESCEPRAKILSEERWCIWKWKPCLPINVVSVRFIRVKVEIFCQIWPRIFPSAEPRIDRSDGLSSEVHWVLHNSGTISRVGEKKKVGSMINQKTRRRGVRALIGGSRRVWKCPQW